MTTDENMQSLAAPWVWWALLIALCVNGNAKIIRLSVAANVQKKGRVLRLWTRAQRFGRIAISVGPSRTTTTTGASAETSWVSGETGSGLSRGLTSLFSDKWTLFVSHGMAEASDAVLDSQAGIADSIMANDFSDDLLFDGESSDDAADLNNALTSENVKKGVERAKIFHEDPPALTAEREHLKHKSVQKHAKTSSGNKEDSSVSMTDEQVLSLTLPKRNLDPSADYTIDGILGFGGMSRVFSATDVRTGEKVAIKTVSMTGTYSTSLLRNELGALQAVGNHPHIVRYRDAFVSRRPPTQDQRARRRLWIVMDRVDGRTLDHAVRSGEMFDAARIARICRQLLEALAHLHAAGYAHRDVKAANVMLEGCDGNVNSPVRLVDFGLGGALRAPSSAPANSVGENAALDATAQSPLGHSETPATKTFVGTPFAMAPEVIVSGGEDPYDASAADVWSVGIMLWQMAHGHAPHMHKFSGLWKLFRAIVSTGAPALDSPEDRVRVAVSPEMLDFYTLCTHYDPMLRPTANALLSHPFLAPAPVDESKTSETGTAEKLAKDTETVAHTDPTISTDRVDKFVNKELIRPIAPTIDAIQGDRKHTNQTAD